MSATMDVDQFSQYFNGAPVLYLEGRQHPIEVFYTKQPQSDYLQAALVSVFQIHQVWLSCQVCASLGPWIVDQGGSRVAVAEEMAWACCCQIRDVPEVLTASSGKSGWLGSMLG